MQTVPDERGKFGPYGGQFVPETLMPALEELIAAYEDARHDPAFVAEFEGLLSSYVGRPLSFPPIWTPSSRPQPCLLYTSRCV